MDEKLERFNSRFYEISSKKARGGKREITLILHEIMPDSTVYQSNGISWKEEYVTNALDTLKGAPIAVEFIDDKKSEIWGHGMTDEIETEDGRMPIFENSEVVGSFINGYINDIELDGVTKRVLLAKGYIYEQRYKNFVDWLVENIPLGNVMGSIEINGLPENKNEIIYEDGYKETGRVPQYYVYSAHALLSTLVKPADPVAKVLEINENLRIENKEESLMDEKVLNQFVDDIKSTIVEINSKNSQYESQILEKDAQIVELNASVAELTAALEQAKKEKQELWDKEDVVYKEMEMLKEEIAKAKIKEKVGELNSAIAEFSDEEKAYAKEEIDAFHNEPMTSEINSVVNKIYAEIGKKNKSTEAEQKQIAELNARKTNDIDIFGEVVEVNNDNENISIF